MQVFWFALLSLFCFVSPSDMILPCSLARPLTWNPAFQVLGLQPYHANTIHTHTRTNQLTKQPTKQNKTTTTATATTTTKNAPTSCLVSMTGLVLVALL